MWSSWPCVSTTASTSAIRSSMGRKSGQDQVDAGLLVLGEQHTAVDDEQLAAVLEHRHVAADFADTAERDHPQAVLRQLRRRAELVVGGLLARLGDRCRTATATAALPATTAAAGRGGGLALGFGLLPLASVAGFVLARRGAVFLRRDAFLGGAAQFGARFCGPARFASAATSAFGSASRSFTRGLTLSRCRLGSTGGARCRTAAGLTCYGCGSCQTPPPPADRPRGPPAVPVGISCGKRGSPDIDAEQSAARPWTSPHRPGGPWPRTAAVSARVDLSRPGHVTGGVGLEDLAQSFRHEMADDADESDRADRQPGQVQAVVAGVEIQIGGRDQIGAGVRDRPWRPSPRRCRDARQAAGSCRWR